VNSYRDISVVKSKFATGKLSEETSYIRNRSIINLLDKFEKLEDKKTGWFLQNSREIITGRSLNNLISLVKSTSDNIENIRVFSQKGEIYTWHYNGRFQWRMRIDNEGSDENVYSQYFYFSEKEKPGKIPDGSPEYKGYSFHKSIDSGKIPAGYVVRNYFTYDKTGLINFNDARIVSFL
jgi:hypothetical protein